MILDDLVRDVLAPPASLRRLAQYVASQAAFGRRLAAVLEDPFVVNHTLRTDRRRLLESPELLLRWHASLSLSGPPARAAPPGPRAPEPGPPPPSGASTRESSV